jgi:homogentisate phytyltransferase/homogentisate geranylgeranyltransferase
MSIARTPRLAGLRPTAAERIATLFQFSRPHTVIATSVQVLTLFFMAQGLLHLDGPGLIALLIALVACLAANIYVVGLNQLTDIAIDRINKPTLPLAAGTLSLPAARWIVALAALLAAGLGLIGGPILLLVVSAVMLVGTLYSLPPRLKQHATWAALSIAATRGLLANVGLLLYYAAALGEPPSRTTLLMVGLFFFGFGIVIALYKDLPDLAGDRLHAIRTLTVRLGPARVIALGRALLTLCYGLPIVAALLSWPAPAAILLLVSHLVLIGMFWRASLAVDISDQSSMMRLYMLLWRMFYAEFIILSLAEVLRSFA